MERCKACGDPIDPDATREKLKKKGIQDSWEENASPWQEMAIRDMEEHDDAEPMQ